MQGEHPLPGPVIEKFAKTGSALTKGVNLLRMFYLISDFGAMLRLLHVQISPACL